MANLVRAQEKAQKASTQSTCSSQSQSWANSQFQSQNQLEEVEDYGKLFFHQDYLNMITYLEDSWNYTVLFGNGPQTSVGVKQMTKLKAFEVFATWLNIQNPDLLLNSRQLQQRVDQWKKNTLKQNGGKRIPVPGLKMKLDLNHCKKHLKRSALATTGLMRSCRIRQTSIQCMNTIYWPTAMSPMMMKMRRCLLEALMATLLHSGNPVRNVVIWVVLLHSHPLMKRSGQNWSIITPNVLFLAPLQLMKQLAVTQKTLDMETEPHSIKQVSLNKQILLGQEEHIRHPLQLPHAVRQELSPARGPTQKPLRLPHPNWGPN